MTHMTAHRFQAIVATYGAEPRRWPDDERAAALAFAAANPHAQGWMDAERGLDAMLDLLGGAAAAHADGLHANNLHERVMAGIDLPEPAPQHPRAMQVMWASLGLVACIAGALFGVDYSLHSLSEVRAQSVLEQTAMIDTE